MVSGDELVHDIYTHRVLSPIRPQMLNSASIKAPLHYLYGVKNELNDPTVLKTVILKHLREQFTECRTTLRGICVCAR